METIKLPKDRRGFVIIGNGESVRVDFLTHIIERKRLGKLTKDEKINVTYELSVPYVDFKAWLKEGKVWQG